MSIMGKLSIYGSALTVCAVAAIVVLFACDNNNRTAAITPKFLYASSCGSVLGPGIRRHHDRNSIPTPGGLIGGVNGYNVDATTGVLTAMSTSPAVTGLSCPEFLTTDPAQKFLFVPDSDAQLLHSYTIASTGALTEVSGSPYAQCSFQLAVDPSGKFLVAPDFCNGNVDAYSIGSDGSLTLVAGSPFSQIANNNPQTVLIDPTGQRVYVADTTEGPGTISVFALSSSGTLTEIPGSPFASGSNSYSISGTADGKYIYVNSIAAVGSEILAFSVNTSTGALTPLTTPSYAGGSCWTSVDATSSVLFTTDCDGNVFSSVIGSDGSLTAAAGSPVTAGNETWPVVGDPSGKFVYAGDDANTGQLFAYTYTSAGVLTATASSPFPAGTYIEGIVVTH